MNKITVRFFAVFREAAGVESRTLDTGSANAKELFGEMARLFPGLAVEAAALVAINDEIVAWEQPIEDGDEVLFFPPVAGG